MISTADFRNGLVVLLDNELMEIVDFQHVKPGKGGAFVRTRFKNVLTGRVLDKTFRAGERMEEARLEERTWQYLYDDGDLYHFMHPESYEQIAVGAAVVGDNKNWMKENDSVNLLFYDGNVIKVAVPIAVVLTITKCDPGVQGDRASGGTKPATLETGVAVQVPLFVNEGDIIKVDTRSGDYIERVSS
ncbi:MAG: elongation factor P [Candidatus Hydrogenedentes bacterium]|nr:elongation factor P [Candidatus Hydrogenedentota bacterium]